jgi:hypothetical protein
LKGSAAEPVAEKSATDFAGSGELEYGFDSASIAARMLGCYSLLQ